MPSPVKQTAERFGIPVCQPERIRRPEAVECLRALAPEAMVVAGYGQIIPQSVIDLAPLGIINVHASLLPQYRGAAPIQWAIVNGETRTGVTTMRIDAGLDTGDMLLRAETEIRPDENAIELAGRLALLGADLLIETLDGLTRGLIVPRKQDAAQATYAPLLKKEDGRIDWRQPAAVIHNRVRGLQPWPGAFTSFRGRPLHIWRSRPAVRDELSTMFHAGHIISLRPLLVSCGAGYLELLEVQQEARKRITASAFVSGQRLQHDEALGETTI